MRTSRCAPSAGGLPLKTLLADGNRLVAVPACLFTLQGLSRASLERNPVCARPVPPQPARAPRGHPGGAQIPADAAAQEARATLEQRCRASGGYFKL